MSVNVEVLRPGSVEELSGVVRDAAAAGHSIRARGGDTKRIFGNLVDAPDRMIDLHGLDAVIDYSPVDLTIAVEPGITLQAIDELLEARRQRLVLDAPGRERSTIGGMFAAGLSGPRRVKYGSLKDFVVGVEVVTSSGEVAKAGGMVVKNVSGYEMARLHYGAHGAFGIVTRLNLRVQPMPEVRVELVATYSEAADALMAGGALLTSSLEPAAVYATRGSDGNWDLHAQIEGLSSFVAAQADKLDHVVHSASSPGRVERRQIEGPSTPDFDWIIDLAETDQELVARMSVPASKQRAAIEALRGLEGATLMADMGSGLVYARCAASAPAVETIDGVAPTTFLALPDELKAGRDVFGPMDSDAATILRRVKQEFDPRGMFSPGRFALHL